MKIGVCTGLNNLQQAAECGFDFVECSASWLAGLSEEEYQEWLARKDSFAIPVLCCNGFLPESVPITGPAADAWQQNTYVDKTFARASALGVKTVVFGSSAARNVPEGADYTQAWRQIADFLRRCIPYCERYDITIAIEPLSRREANIVNLVSEAQLLAAMVDHPRIAVLGDTYHMDRCAEPFSALTRAGRLLRHVHISCPMVEQNTRIYPAPDDGCPDYAEVAAVLKEMGYQGAVSVEAGCKDFAAEGKAAVECLKALM